MRKETKKETLGNSVFKLIDIARFLSFIFRKPMPVFQVVSLGGVTPRKLETVTLQELNF
jgi:hypothetical protein